MATILLVEDNAVEQQIVQLLAAKAGVKVCTASTAYKALDLLNADHSFAAVFINYMLPAMDGIECTRQIRSLSNGRNSIPIIAITALVNDEACFTCFEAGMDDYLGKPYTPEQFNALLQRWMAPVQAN